MYLARPTKDLEIDSILVYRLLNFQKNRPSPDSRNVKIGIGKENLI